MKYSDSIRVAHRDIRIGKSQGIWIGSAIKAQLFEYWAYEEFKTDSAWNKINQSKSQGASVHQGRSISFSVHKKRLSKELGRKVDAAEVFRNIQYNESKGWVYPYAEQTYKPFEEHRATQESTDSSCDNTHLWTEVIRVNKKCRVYGMGFEACLVKKAHSSQPLQSSPQVPQQF